MKIYVVDNGGQWTHREWRVLKYLDVDTEIIPNTTPFEELDVDGLILSGGSPRIGHESPKLGNSGDYLNKADFPILGICVGAQFMALHYGGTAETAEVPEYGKTMVTIEEENELFTGVTSPFQAWESHNDEVKILPDAFKNLAHSKNCAHQAFVHREKPFYGLQFHPEVEHTEFGEEIFKNFIEICRQ